MPWGEIVKVLIANAPAIISTVDEGIRWIAASWAEVAKAAGQDPATITREQLLASLDQIDKDQLAIDALK